MVSLIDIQNFNLFFLFNAYNQWLVDVDVDVAHEIVGEILLYYSGREHQ